MSIKSMIIRKRCAMACMFNAMEDHSIMVFIIESRDNSSAMPFLIWTTCTINMRRISDIYSQDMT